MVALNFRGVVGEQRENQNFYPLFLGNVVWAHFQQTVRADDLLVIVVPVAGFLHRLDKLQITVFDPEKIFTN